MKTPGMLKAWRAAPDHTALFLARYPGLVAQARRALQLRREQAVELVHEAFLHFVRNQPDLDGIGQLDAYLFGMLRKLHVSNLRRAARQRTLSMAEYDSAALGLRDAAGPAEIAALQELAQVCAYCATRRHTSRTGSVLALRYFYGRSPATIASMMCATVPTVSQWLHLARREAREYLTNPEQCTNFGPAMLPPRIGLTVAPEARPAAFVTWLRQQPVGTCLTSDQLTALEDATPLDRAALAHIVSCADCLSTVERITLSGRRDGDHEDDLPDRPSRSTRSAAQLKALSPADVHRDRLTELRAHRPATLCVHVNGFLIGSHRLTSDITEFTTRVHLDEPIEFVEVLSEQGLRLAFLEASDLGQPIRGALTLGDDRTLHLALDISEAWPSITVRYVDPHFDQFEASSATAITDDADERVSNRVSDRVRKPFRLFAWPPLPTLAWRLAVLLLIIWIATSPSQAAELATRVWRFTTAAVQRVLGTRGREIPSRPMITPGASRLAPALVPIIPPVDANATVAKSAATIDLDAVEMDLLTRIDAIGGLLGDEVTVDRIARPGPPRLLVHAIVSNAPRKAQLLTALGARPQRSPIDLDILTAEEALAATTAVAVASTTTTPQSEPPPQLRMAQPSEPHAAAHDLTRDALLRSGADAVAEADAEAHVRRFSTDVLKHSLQARLHAQVAASLVDRVATRWLSMTAPVRRQWARLVIAHTDGVEQETAALRTSLARTFDWPEPDTADADSSREQTLAAAAQRLAALAIEHDVAVGRAFAVSTESAGDTAATRSDFGASLREAERLSRQLASLAARAGGS